MLLREAKERKCPPAKSLSQAGGLSSLVQAAEALRMHRERVGDSLRLKHLVCHSK